jgi:hypothetical protein
VTKRQLEKLVQEVQDEHRRRNNVPKTPIVRRKTVRRRRPNTAILQALLE